MSSILRIVGIDISKDWLDNFAAPEGRASRFSNDNAGFREADRLDRLRDRTGSPQSTAHPIPRRGHRRGHTPVR